MRKLALVLALMAWVAPAWATVITTGDVDPGGAGTQPDPWHIPISLGVGNTGSGTLNVAAGGEVITSTTSIGLYSGAREF